MAHLCGHFLPPQVDILFPTTTGKRPFKSCTRSEARGTGSTVSQHSQTQSYPLCLSVSDFLVIFTTYYFYVVCRLRQAKDREHLQVLITELDQLAIDVDPTRRNGVRWWMLCWPLAQLMMFTLLQCRRWPLYRRTKVQSLVIWDCPISKPLTLQLHTCLQTHSHLIFCVFLQFRNTLKLLNHFALLLQYMISGESSNRQIMHPTRQPYIHVAKRNHSIRWTSHTDISPC